MIRSSYAHLLGLVLGRALLYVRMIIRGIGIGCRRLGIVAREGAALSRRKIAAVTSLVFLEWLAVFAQAMLSGVEKVVIGQGYAVKGNQPCASKQHCSSMFEGHGTFL
jgi:hypothetical protein